MRSTIKDVARVSGFSITTVSMVLNNKDVSISQATRDKVWEAVRELNYRPNQLAVSLIKNNSSVLGLIIPDNANSFFAELSKAIEEEAHTYGYNLLYGNTDNNLHRDLEYLQTMEDHRVEGIIYVRSAAGEGDSPVESRVAKCIAESQIPVVAIDRTLPDEWGCQVDSVILDHYKGGYMATQYLLQMGHRRIGAYTGPSDLASSQLRLEGYRAALEEAGIAYDPQLVVEGDYQLSEAKEALQRFLDLHATGIFCFNDQMAAAVYKEMRRRELGVPEQMSVVGFDNTPFGEMLYPGLTTVAQPVEEMCSCAVRLLLEKVGQDSGQGEGQKILFEPKLLIRQSVRQPGDQ